MLQACEISVPTSLRSAFPRALKKIANPRAHGPKTPGTQERESRNACPALGLRYCNALCDVKLRQEEGNGRKFRHIEINNRVIS